MDHRVKYIFYILFFSCSGILSGQSVSDLSKKLKAAKSDTARINKLNDLTAHYIYENTDSAVFFNRKSLRLSSETDNRNFNFQGYYLKAFIHLSEQNYPQALVSIQMAEKIASITDNIENEIKTALLKANILQQNNQDKEALGVFLEAYETCKKKNYKEGLLDAGTYIGLYYKDRNDNTNSLKYFLKNYPLAIELKDSISIFNCSINLGTLYERTGDVEEALRYYRQALNLNRQKVDEDAAAICYFKIGRVHAGRKQNDSARFYLGKTMDIHLKLNDEVGLIFDYSYRASLYDAEGDLNKAMENYLISLELALKYRDSSRIFTVYNNMAVMFEKRKDFDKALEYFTKCMDYANSKLSAETYMKMYLYIADIYKRQSKYKEALEHYEKYKSWSDSIYNVKDIRKQTELKLGFEFNQVEEKLKEKAETERKINDAERAKDRQFLKYLWIGLGMVSFFLLLAVRFYITKRKANHVLEKQKVETEIQKKLVEEKNREITDSINYAHHIQNACLPEEDELKRLFPQHALFFQPKDVVSGDFYWAEKKDDSVMIAVADCTGHGVPGAITSMIGSMLLNEIFHVKKIYRPDEVLIELNRLVMLTLRQKPGSLSKDGMDVAFCNWNQKTNLLMYSGANRPVYILRKGEKLIELKPTKQSVGGLIGELQPYQYHEIQLQKGDTVVLSTDGFADQFGGTNEKKFTTKLFKSKLEEMTGEETSGQISSLKNEFRRWQGEYNQTDDVLVFLFKI